MKKKFCIAAVAVLVLIGMLIVLTTSHKIEEKKNVVTTTTTTTSTAATTIAKKETTTTTTKKTTTKKTTAAKPKTTTTTTSAATTTVAATEEPVEIYESYLEEPIETYEAYSEEPVEIYATETYYGDYSPYDLQSMGVINWGGYRYTYYSENVLPGYGLQIEGRHTDEYGFVCDGDGYICVASSSLPWGTVVDTPFGRAGKVYDSGCAWDVIDIYVNW